MLKQKENNLQSYNSHFESFPLGFLFFFLLRFSLFFFTIHKPLARQFWQRKRSQQLFSLFHVRFFKLAPDVTEKSPNLRNRFVCCGRFVTTWFSASWKMCFLHLIQLVGHFSLQTETTQTEEVKMTPLLSTYLLVSHCMQTTFLRLLTKDLG